jgi:hypothetical protein
MMIRFGLEEGIPTEEMHSWILEQLQLLEDLAQHNSD